MKKSKILAFALVLTLLTGALAMFSACGPGDADDAAGPITADVFWYTFADTFLATVRNDMIELEAGFPNLNVTHHDSMDNQAEQIQQIETAIVRGTDLLIVNIVNTGAEDVAHNIVDLAREADVPVLFFNREVSDAVINAYEHSAFIGTDAAEAGVFQGMAIAEFLLEGDNINIFDVDGNGEIRYVMLRGEHGNAEAFFRTYYSVRTANELLAASGVQLVPSAANETSTLYADDGISNFFLYANWSAAEAHTLMSTALVAHSPATGDIELVIANNDDAALGAISALAEVGFNTGPGSPKIPIFGVDATDVARIAINDGTMTGTVMQDGRGMAQAVLELSNNIANGDELMANTGHHNVDVGVAKIRIPHGIVSGDGAAVAAVPAPAGPITADVFWYTFADTFLATVRNDMIELEAGFPNLNVTHHDSRDDQAEQIQQIETAIVRGTDLLIVNIVNTGAEDVAHNIVNLARGAGVPVLFFNREVSDAVINAYEHSAFIGTDAAEAGVFQGMAIANFLLTDDNLDTFDVDGDGQITYVMLRGEHGNAEAFFRTYYSVRTANELLAASGVQLVPSVANETSTLYADDGISNFFLYANWSAAEAHTLMSTALVAHSPAAGDIELVIANNDDAALGAISALAEIGFNTGPGSPKVPIFGVDATDVARIAIADGTMTGTVMQDGRGMAQAVLELSNNIAAGDHLMANTGHHNVDAGVAKIRIPHGIVY
jgi:methyl-galactoside transport system substrate-binding protein